MTDNGKNVLTGDRIIRYSGIALITMSLITFAYLIPGTLDAMNSAIALGSQLTGIPGFSLTPDLFYLFIALTLLTLLVSIFSLFVHRQNISIGFQETKNMEYFHYLMIFILVQIILTEIIAYFVPTFGTGFPFNEPVAIQNFVFVFETFFQSFIFQLLPITVAILLLLLFTGKLNRKTVLSPEVGIRETFLISGVISATVSLIVGGPVLNFLSDFVTFFMLNFIFVRFGFLKAFLTNFTVSITNVTATLISGNAILSNILPIFLFYLGFLGMYSAVQIGMSLPKYLPSQDHQNIEPEKVKKRKIPRMEPFIRSNCSDCGHTVFHVKDDMGLKCARCGKELEKDATGEMNISIEFRRVNKT